MKRTALITGATSGLGYEFVKLFAKDEFDLVLVARNEKKMEEIKQSLPNNKVTIIKKDLSLPNAAKEVFESIQREEIQIDILINNAGFGLLGSFEDLDIHQQTEMINLNITALTELTHYFLPQLKKSNSAKILNVASTAAFQPGPSMAVYFATKAYVLSFSEAIAEEVKEHNITVTTLCPGPTNTNFGAVANSSNAKMFDQAMTAEAVATQGYNALFGGKGVTITGFVNKMGVLGAKFVPRRLAMKIAKNVMKEN
ncbi:SDR family NAD(P)-dependent oxidoreductase [Bacillus solimangrovi]|uniref:Short-chain dehydrogenase n=1 Tax=Bacillus solimangrovi TaxID=1305675 RepID=A0A1E5LGA3_9BACI|nr:SDR family oxidoreductase [Bacillus solimangrovi]OEH93109.1 short-chain dehydrogenase [Bacillus solimangrovi]